jgi:hypothetical protein
VERECCGSGGCGDTGGRCLGCGGSTGSAWVLNSLVGPENFLHCRKEGKVVAEYGQADGEDLFGSQRHGWCLVGTGWHWAVRGEMSIVQVGAPSDRRITQGKSEAVTRTIWSREVRVEDTFSFHESYGELFSRR